MSSELAKQITTMLLTPYLSQEELQKLVLKGWSWLRFAAVILHNFYCIPGYLLLNWLLLSPLYLVCPRLYAAVENRLYNWLLYIVGSWSYGANIEVHELGDNVYELEDCRLLFICNHQSTADVPLMMMALTARAKHSLLWIMAEIFKYTNFGVVSLTHGDYFLNTNNYKSGHLIEHCTNDYNKSKNAIVLFPEGGFRRKRVVSSNKYASENNLPLMTHVTYPRFGAYNDVMSKEVGITHVVDLTIIYEDLNAPLSIIDIARGHRKSRVIFHYEIFDCATNNCDDKWLTRRFQLKEEMLRQFYADKCQLLDSLKPSVVVSMNWCKVLAIHLFYLSVCVISYIVFKRITY